MSERRIGDHVTQSGQRPSLGFVGIHSNGRPEMAVSQNETLAALFADAGYRVRRTSGMRHPALRTLHQIASILSWRRVDVIVIAVFSGRSFWIADFATLLGRLRGSRLVLFLHGGRLPEFGPQHRQRVERVLTRADLVLAPSDFLASTFQGWGLDVRVVPNVLALDRYTFRQRSAIRPRILWMRTFHEHYDPLTAIRAFARIVEEVPEATMTMAGADHGLLPEVKAEAERLGIADRVDFPGYIRSEAKAVALADHDVFLNTNIIDNMPISVLEAGASGLIPVATAVGGIPKLLTSGVDSVLVPAGDDEAIASVVVRLLRDPSFAANLSQGARRMAERSGWPSVRRQWEQQLALVAPGTWSR